jgi:uncharacterized membrane protein
MVVIPAGLLLLAALLLHGQAAVIALVLGVLVIPISGLVAFVAQNRTIKPFAVQPALVRELELAAGPEKLPPILWLGLPPMALLGGTAAYLHSIWNRIPVRFPVHFDLEGTPNRWADRTVRGVYGPLFLGGELAVVMLALAVAGWYGTRRSEPLRKPMLVVMLTVEWTMALLFSAVSLNIVGSLAAPPLVLALVPLLLIVPALVYVTKKAREPRSQLDPTPNECWKGGIIYYNPDDAALFVQRRDGIGMTVNLANRWGWVMYAGILLAVAGGAFLLG